MSADRKLKQDHSDVNHNKEREMTQELKDNVNMVVDFFRKPWFFLTVLGVLSLLSVGKTVTSEIGRANMIETLSIGSMRCFLVMFTIFGMMICMKKFDTDIYSDVFKDPKNSTNFVIALIFAIAYSWHG
jgi:succinate dehydrogenase hydrophobic anchor subunit